MPCFVYVLSSQEGYHYTGQTEDLGRRLNEHNGGACHSTKHGRDWVLVHVEEYATRREAMERERYLKSSAGRRWMSKHIAGWSPSR